MKNSEMFLRFLVGMPENFVNEKISSAEINQYIKQFCRDHKIDPNSIPDKMDKRDKMLLLVHELREEVAQQVKKIEKKKKRNILYLWASSHLLFCIAFIVHILRTL